MGTYLENMVGKSGESGHQIQNYGESPFSSIFSLPAMQTICQTVNICKHSHIMSTKKLQTGDAVNSETLKAMTKGS